MKKRALDIKTFVFLFGCMLITSIFLSCFSMLNAIATSSTSSTSTSATPRLRWSMGAYTDQFGDRTGDFYIQYSGEVDALFTGGGWTNKQTLLRELSFSQKEGLSFYVINVDLAPAILSTVTDALFNIKLSDESTIEFNGKGMMNNNRYTYFIPYSDELLNVLLQENIIVRFATSNGRQAQFQLPPKFRESYEELQSRQSVTVNLPLRWSVGAFTNQWGDRTGDYYVQFDGEVNTVYSSASSRNQQITIREISFSQKEGLSFNFSRGALASLVSGDVLFRIELPDETTVDFNGNGNDRGVLFIPYSEELLNILLQENVIIIFAPRNSARIQCAFRLPSRFRDAYGLLQNR